MTSFGDADIRTGTRAVACRVTAHRRRSLSSEARMPPLSRLRSVAVIRFVPLVEAARAGASLGVKVVVSTLITPGVPAAPAPLADSGRESRRIDAYHAQCGRLRPRWRPIRARAFSSQPQGPADDHRRPPGRPSWCQTLRPSLMRQPRYVHNAARSARERAFAAFFIRKGVLPGPGEARPASPAVHPPRRGSSAGGPIPPHPRQRNRSARALAYTPQSAE
jgi:hypothetical protein